MSREIAQSAIADASRSGTTRDLHSIVARSRDLSSSKPKPVMPCPGSQPPKRAGRFDPNAASQCLRNNAAPKSTARCAKHVRLALMAGGLPLKNWPPVAKDYGPYLKGNGFEQVDPAGYVPQKGDVAVIQPYPGGNPAGHIAMYDGEQWVSDFKQRDQWGGPGYRNAKPPIQYMRCAPANSTPLP